ncbi:ead/Ea22-like family protein [Salmonella enterica]|nr:ead/Ea22-like family protein [Salmonella enterica]
MVDECGHAAQIITALLDENLQLQREKDAIEAVALALRDDMRQARELLAAAERSMAEQSAIVAAAERLVRCKGRYHSEQNYRALAALFGVTTPDLPPLEHENVHFADAAEMEIAALRQRINELESREINLPAACADDEYFIDGVFQALRYERDVERAIRAAGIGVKGE